MLHVFPPIADTTACTTTVTTEPVLLNVTPDDVKLIMTQLTKETIQTYQVPSTYVKLLSTTHIH